MTQATNNVFNTATVTTNTDTVNTTATDHAVESNAVIDNLPEEVKGLIGPGKKYSSIEAALKSIPHAQTHIANLENETKTLKAEQQAARDEILATIEADRTSRSNTNTQTIDTDAVAESVITKMNAKVVRERQEANLNTTNDELVKKFGSVDSALKAMTTKASEIGLSIDTLKLIAAENPNAFLAYFDIKRETTDVYVPSSSVRTEVLSQHNNTPEQGTYAWYSAERKKRNADRPGSGDNWFFSIDTTRQRSINMDKMGVDKYLGRQKK